MAHGTIVIDVEGPDGSSVWEVLDDAESHVDSGNYDTDRVRVTSVLKEVHD